MMRKIFYHFEKRKNKIHRIFIIRSFYWKIDKISSQLNGAIIIGTRRKDIPNFIPLIILKIQNLYIFSPIIQLIFLPSLKKRLGT